MLCRNKVSRKSFKIFIRDIAAMNTKHMQHTAVSHDLKLISNMEAEELNDPDNVRLVIIEYM